MDCGAYIIIIIYILVPPHTMALPVKITNHKSYKTTQTPKILPEYLPLNRFMAAAESPQAKVWPVYDMRPISPWP